MQMKFFEHVYIQLTKTKKKTNLFQQPTKLFDISLELVADVWLERHLGPFAYYTEPVKRGRKKKNQTDKNDSTCNFARFERPRI